MLSLKLFQRHRLNSAAISKKTEEYKGLQSLVLVLSRNTGHMKPKCQERFETDLLLFWPYDP